jgi:hypothetical protein
MTALQWDQVGQRKYETGVDRGVLYVASNGVYDGGVAWNGLETITEKPTGGEATATYADNIKYLNLLSIEEFAATIEAYTYPDEFGPCDGTVAAQDGVYVGQQPRQTFGLCYRTKIGNDVDGAEAGYKLHLCYGLLAKPSEKAYMTINDTPEAITFSWDVTSTPVEVPGYKPSATIVIDSTKVDADALGILEDMLYGTVGDDPFLPLPEAVLSIFDGTITLATPTAPTYNSSTDIVTIPSVTGVIYQIDGEAVPSGSYGPIAANVFIVAVPDTGYYFPSNVDTDWLITFA